MTQTSFFYKLPKLPAVKKQSSLVRKLSSVNRITVFFTAIVCGLALAVFFYRILTAQHEQSTKASVAGFQLLLDDFGSRAEGAAASIAGRPDVVQAARSRSHADAYKILAELIGQMHVDFIVLTDTRGNIIARGHSERFGDNIINQNAVREAVRGRATYSYEKAVLVRGMPRIRQRTKGYRSDRFGIQRIVRRFFEKGAQNLRLRRHALRRYGSGRIDDLGRKKRHTCRCGR